MSAIDIFRQKKLFFIGLFFAIFVAFLDLYSKYAAFSFLERISLERNWQYPILEVTSFFNLVKVWNNGVSFGMFSNLDNAKYFILFVNSIILLILLIWLYRANSAYLTAALSLIIGGAIGNSIDRIYNGAVADFLDFYISNYHWPAFNLADSAVFLGVALLLLEDFFCKNKPKDDAK
jgi:signal peptidase II